MEGPGLPKRRKVTQVVGLEVWWNRLKELEARDAAFAGLLDNEAARRARITN